MVDDRWIRRSPWVRLISVADDSLQHVGQATPRPWTGRTGMASGIDGPSEKKSELKSSAEEALLAATYD